MRSRLGISDKLGQRVGRHLMMRKMGRANGNGHGGIRRREGRDGDTEVEVGKEIRIATVTDEGDEIAWTVSLEDTEAVRDMDGRSGVVRGIEVIEAKGRGSNGQNEIEAEIGTRGTNDASIETEMGGIRGRGLANAGNITDAARVRDQGDETTEASPRSIYSIPLINRMEHHACFLRYS